MGRARSWLIGTLLVLGLLAPGAVPAMTSAGGSVDTTPPSAPSATTPTATGSSSAVTYDYDALGRLVQAEMPSLNTVQAYRYDPAGNIVSSSLTPLTTLSIGGVSASQGPSGTQITIYGSGFSSTPSQNSVSFNGTAATVVSASSTQLVVTIPTGATSGSISVATGGTTVNSVSAFTVTSPAAVPSITAISPTLADVKTLVTITGSNFAASAASNKIQFGSGAWTSANGRTVTTLTTLVPPIGAWGKVRVLTPAGVGVSSLDFFSPPSGIAASTIGSTGRLQAGVGSVVTLSTAGKSSLQVFDGNAGDLLALGVTNDTVANLTLQVFSPDGSLLTSGTVTGGGQGVQLPSLPRSGTYEVVVNPGSNTGAATLTLAAPVQSSLTIGGSTQTVNLNIPGQRALLTFAGTPSAYVSLTLSSVTLSAAHATIFAPDGSTVLSAAFGTAGATLSPQLPSTGTYTVLIDPSGPVSGSLGISVALSPAPTLTLNGSSNLSLTDTNPVSSTFRATAGQYPSLEISEGGDGIQGANVTVLKPDGTTLTTGVFTATTCGGCTGYSGSTVLNMGPLPSSGTYTILVQQTGAGGSGTLSLNLWLPVTGALTANAAASSIAVGVGQDMQLTFAGTAGQYPSLEISESRDGIQGANITVLKPDGTTLTTGVFTATTCAGCSGFTGSAVVSMGPLPSSGTYTILVQQTTAGTGTLSLSLTTQ
jgi:IPT/TIG domain